MNEEKIKQIFAKYEERDRIQGDCVLTYVPEYNYVELANELIKPETEKLKEILRQVYNILAEAPVELNMNDYDEEQVKKLNDKMVKAYSLLNYEQRQFLI